MQQGSQLNGWQNCQMGVQCIVCCGWAEARIKIARMTLTIKLDRNWNSFQLANSAPPLSVTDSAIAPSARMLVRASICLHPDYPVIVPVCLVPTRASGTARAPAARRDKNGPGQTHKVRTPGVCHSTLSTRWWVADCSAGDCVTRCAPRG